MLSWNELLDTLKGDVQEKSKNPFFGAFLVTWALRHWEIFIKLYDFDSKEMSRIEMIKEYLNSLPRYDFWITVIITFGVIILSYAFLNITRVISNISEKIITPSIYKWTAGKVSIVLKEDFDKLLLREEDLKAKLRLEKNQIVELERINEELEKEIIKLKEVEIIKDTKNPEDNPLKNKIDEEKINNIMKLMNTYYDRDKYIDVFSKILSGISLEKEELYVSRLVTNRLIRFVKDDSGRSYGYGFYELTPLGDMVFDKLNFEENSK